jgi:hypothetical protein
MRLKKLAAKVASFIVNRSAKQVVQKYYLSEYPEPTLVILHAKSAFGVWALRSHWFGQIEEIFGVVGLREINISLVPNIQEDFPVIRFYGHGITILARDSNSGYLGDEVIDFIPISDYPENN